MIGFHCMIKVTIFMQSKIKFINVSDRLFYVVKLTIIAQSKIKVMSLVVHKRTMQSLEQLHAKITLLICFMRVQTF